MAITQHEKNELISRFDQVRRINLKIKADDLTQALYKCLPSSAMVEKTKNSFNKTYKAPYIELVNDYLRDLRKVEGWNKTVDNPKPIIQTVVAPTVSAQSKTQIP